MAMKMFGFEDLESQIEGLVNAAEGIDEVIQSAVPPLESSMKECIRESANRGYATGELEKSIKGTKTKQNVYGHFAAVGPTGTDSKGVRNGEKMAYMEYGTSTQEARPVVKRAVSRAEKNCVENMQEKFNEVSKRRI